MRNLFGPTSMFLLTGLVVVLPVVHASAQQPLESVFDHRPSISLQLRSNVEISSVIVRVGDVVQPVAGAPRGWEELSKKVIGPLPSSGGRLTMERQRISECLARSGLLPGIPVWSGPETVTISYVPDVLQKKIDIKDWENPTTQVASRQTMFNHAYQSGTFAEKPAFSSSFASAEAPALLPAERNRIERMILAAFEKSHESVITEFDVTIPSEDAGLNRLKDLRGIRNVRLGKAPDDGRNQLWIAGDTELRAVEAVIDLDLVRLPKVVFTTTALNRGDIVTVRDVVIKPIPKSQFDVRHVTDIDSILGMELKRPLSINRPFLVDDVDEPIVIERGDIVQLQVISAGVIVTTEAKALGPAAAGESIFVETSSPKQKLSARAVRSGLVEIVSRPVQMESKY